MQHFKHINNQNSIDFAPLDNLKLHELTSRDFQLVAGAVILGLALFFVDNALLSALYVIGAIAGLVYYFIRRTSDTNKVNSDASMQFAQVNHFAFSESIDTTTINSKFGTVFQHGHSKNIRKQFSGEFVSLPFSLFNYAYSESHGKSRQDYDLLVLELTLPRTMPHMIIDSLVETGNGQSSTLPINFDKSQRIQLEGDFHKYFDLYAPDTYGITALTIIAPDAMEALMRHAALCDIEIVSSKLYFYWPDVPRNRTHYEEAFNCAREVLAEIGDKLLKDNVFKSESQAAIHSFAGASGVRLKNKNTTIFITIAVGAAYIVAKLFPESIYQVPFLIVILIFSISKVYKDSKRTRLRNELLTRYRQST